MNVEKTIEFILGCQAKAEVEMAAIRQQQKKAEQEMAAIRQHSQRETAAIRTLIKAGMKMLVKQGETIREVAEAQKDLAKAQKVTEIKLQAFIDSLRHGRNGNHRKN